jgi:hypothetical protein
VVLGADSAFNRNEYQESSWGVNGGLRLRLTNSPPSVSRLSRQNVEASTSHNPMVLHGLFTGVYLPLLDVPMCFSVPRTYMPVHINVIIFYITVLIHVSEMLIRVFAFTCICLRDMWLYLRERNICACSMSTNVLNVCISVFMYVTIVSVLV